jgi:uncharacterized phiE125 gp8 family phage protein
VRYRIRTVTPVGTIPPLLDPEAAKAFLKVEGSADDSVIADMVMTAMGEVERFTGHVLTERELELITCGFPLLPELISLARDPVTEILSVKYSDPTSGDEVTLDADEWRWSESAPDQVLPALRQSWPVAAAEAGSVRVRFNAGYEEGLCPAPLVSAVKNVLMNLYDCRGEGEGLTDDIRRSLRSFRSGVLA